MKKLLLLLFFGMIFLSGSINAALTDGLVSYYKLDDTSGAVVDSHGTNNGINNGAARNVAGKINKAFQFSGNRGNMTNISSTFNVGTAKLTINLWTYITNTNQGGLFFQIGNGSVGGIGVGVGATSMNDNGNDLIGIFEQVRYIDTNSVLGSGWVMVTMRIHPSGVPELFINGTSVGNFSGTNATADTGGWSSIGDELASGLPFEGKVDEIGVWNRTLTNAEITELYNSGSGSAYPFSTPFISVTLNSPANNSQITTNFTIYNATITPSTFNVTNATHTFWFNNGTRYSTTTNTITGNTANTTTFNVSLPVPGNYYWNVLGVQGNGNGTNSSYATNNFTIRYSLVTTNSAFYNATEYETARNTFTAQITTNGTAPTNAFLVYNTTIRSATISTINSTAYNLSSSIDIPAGVTNNTFYFNMTLGGLLTTTDSFQQNVSEAVFVGCNATYSNDFLNITFRDEVSNAYINATIPSSTFYYWLGNGTTYKSLTYANTTDNSYSNLFCASPAGYTFNVNYSISYKQNSTYPQRTFEQRTAQSYTSSVTGQTLYLLGSSDGIYVTFQVTNTADQVLSGVISNITRSGNIISGGMTGSDGGITYWLNPNHVYTGNFFLSPYPFFTTTQQFTQTSYTIVLGSAVTSNVSDYHAGINYTIQPLDRSLDNDTIYNFNFSITSSFWSLEAFGFNITNGTGTFIGSASGNGANGGIASLNLNTSGNQSFRMNYYWTINNTNITGSVTWLIIDTSGNTFSISRLVNDFNDYVGTGLFGLNDFGIGIIIFVIIIGTTGILKMKVGISNTAVILGVMWALVALFDVSFGILPNPVGAISNFPTIFMGLIFMGVMFREVFT